MSYTTLWFEDEIPVVEDGNGVNEDEIPVVEDGNGVHEDEIPVVEDGNALGNDGDWSCVDGGGWWCAGGGSLFTDFGSMISLTAAFNSRSRFWKSGFIKMAS